jgi:glycosyltransferase involved in cell wall biosynthesis
MTEQPLRIGLNLLYLVPGAGGAGTYALELMPALLEVEPGTKLTAFVTHRVPEPVLAAPWAGRVEWVTYEVEPASRRALVTQHVEIPRAAAKRELDVLHSPANIGVLATGRVANTVTALDLIWLHPSTSPLGPRARLRAKLLFTLCSRAADRILTISDATKRDLVATTSLDSDRIDVTPLAVAEDTIEPTPETELRARLGLDDGPFVLTVAQKQPHKNLGAVIRALAELDGARLVLAGAPAPHEAELRALAERLGVAERIRFLDWVSAPDLEGLYRAATCFVLPSLIEGFGLPVLEAMRHGTPVACSDRSALAEVAGDAALLFDPDDQAAVTGALRRLVEDTQLRGELVQRGLQRCAEFTWRNTAEGTLASYRRAVEARRR